MNPTTKQLNKMVLSKKESVKLVNDAYKALRKAEKSLKNNCVASYLLQEAQSKCCFITHQVLK